MLLCFCLRCLVHILRETTVKYSKIRSFHKQCQFDICRHEVRYGCVREDECFYAHSLIELKVWIMQSERGMCVCGGAGGLLLSLCKGGVGVW
jgi:hypothetical protein